MSNSLLVVAIVIAAAMTFVLTGRLRRVANPNKILLRIKARYQTLMPLVADLEPLDDDRLWEAIGGRRGLWGMFRDAMSILTLHHAWQLDRADPQEYADNTRRTEMIAICSFGALVDDFFRSFHFEVPRNYARTAARNYWTLMQSTQVLIQAYVPEMVEKVDAAL